MPTPTSDLVGARAVDVKVTDDELTVQLEDGRALVVPLAWYPRLLHGTKRERALAGRRSGETQRSLNRWFESRSSTRPNKRRPATARRAPRR